MLELGLAGETCLPGAAEDFLEVVVLRLADDVEHQVGVHGLHAIDDRREVGCFVERCAIRLLHDERGQFLLVRRFGDVHDEGAFAFHGEAALLQVGHHGSDDVVDVAFAFPPVELHAERAELAAHAFE